MLIQVDNDRVLDVPDGYDGDDSRSVAFRHVHKRREHDYQELTAATRVVAVVAVSRDAAEVYLSNYGKD